MRYTLLLAPSIALLLAIGACEYIDKARYSVAKFAAYGVMAECMLSRTERQANRDAVNGWLATNGAVARVSALDCNGDGSPDL